MSDVVITGSGAPPLSSSLRPTGVGVGCCEGSDLSASGGGSAGFTNGTCWDVVAGQSQLLSDAADFLDQLEDSPATRSAALLRAMGRVRDELDRIPESARLDDPVTLQLRDALIIARRLLSPLR